VFFLPIRSSAGNVCLVDTMKALGGWKGWERKRRGSSWKGSDFQPQAFFCVRSLILTMLQGTSRSFSSYPNDDKGLVSRNVGQDERLDPVERLSNLP
jgi:hypothetical protein